MDGRDFAPPPHLLSDRGSLAHRSAARGTVQHPGPFQAGKYFPSPIAMGAHSAGSMMGNSSASLMGTFLTSGLGSAPAHPAVPTSSPSEPAFRGPHAAGASQLWFSHSHEAPGYPRFSGGLASTFLPMSHLDHHGNSNVLYGQHRFYESQKDNFYLRNLPAQPTLLSANHNFPSIARAAPGHPIGSCSRDRENSHMQKGHKESDRYGIAKEPGKEKLGKGESKERQAEEDGKDRGKGVPPMTVDAHCKEDMHQRGSCESHRKKHLNSCLMTSKVVNGDPGKAMLPSCTGGMQHQGVSMSQSRCAKDKMRSEQEFVQQQQQQQQQQQHQQQQHDSAQHQYGECLERRQMLHHAVSYTVPSSLPNIPPPLNSTSGSFPCLQLRSNPDVMCSLQDKAGRELKMSGATFVPSVGHLSDPSQSFQVASDACHVDRSDHSKDRGHEMAAPAGHHHPHHHPHHHHMYSNSFPHLKAEGKGERRPEWSPNAAAATRLKNLEYLNSATSDSPYPNVPHSAKNCLEKGGYFEMPPSQDCSRPIHQEALCVKLSQSCCTLDRPQKESQGQGSQKVARIRHQQHRPPEMEQTGSGSDAKRKSIELSSLGYNGPHLAPWAVQGQGPAISISEERKNPYLDPFSTSLQQAALMNQGSVLSQEMQAPPDEVSAMKNLLKYSNQALIVGQKTPFVGFGNMKASCAHQEGKFQGGKGQQEVERPDCARSRENEPPQGDGEVRQPPVGIAVAVARQKDNLSRQDPSFGPSSHRQSRSNQGIKAGSSSRSMHVVDLDAEEERSRLCDERLGLAGRELLLQENKDLVEFARMHPASGCPGDLTSHLMMAGGSSLQAGQLGGDPASHTHPGHPHWLPRTRSPSIWMGGHSYGIGHPALHQNLPPGFPSTMSSAMQPVFPLSQDSTGQLVILPPEPSPHAAAHPLADVMDQASLWPPMYTGRGPATHIQHPSQLPVYSRSQFLRQQELYALQQQQQRAAQALEMQRQPQHQRKSEDHQSEFAEPTSEKTSKSSQKSVALNSSKNFSSPTSLPPASCPAKLSPFCHSPAPRQPSKCPTPGPLTPCTLPVCPATSSALVPRSPAVSPVLIQNPKGKEAEEKRVEGQPPQDFPKSLEPDLPPGYTFPAASRSYSSPSLRDVHPADPADTEAMQTTPTAAEPEQSRTATPSVTPHCDAPCTIPLVEADSDAQDDAKIETAAEEPKDPGDGQPAPDVDVIPPADATSSQGDLEELGGLVNEDILNEESPPSVSHPESVQGAPEDLRDSEEETVEQVTIISTIPSPNTSEETLVDIKNLEEQTPEKTDAEGALVQEEALEEPREVECEKEEEVGSSPASPTEDQSQGPVCGLDALIAATIDLGDLPALREVYSSPPGASPSLNTGGSSYGSGMHGIALLSELASLEFSHQKSSEVIEDDREELVAFNLQNLATIAAAWSLVEAASVDNNATGTGLTNKQCGTAYAPPVRVPRRTFTWVPKIKPVCPLKAAIDELDSEEVEIRMRLAELQRRYKEKQRELVKLQRRHERDERSRSPARRGPGRPRKRKHSCTLTSIRQVNPQAKYEAKKAKSLKTTLNLHCSDMRSDEEPKRKKSNISEESYSRLMESEVKLRCKATSCPQNNLASKLARKMSQLKQKTKSKAVPPVVSPFRRKESTSGSKIQKKLCPPRSTMESPRQRHCSNQIAELKNKSGATSSAEADKDDDRDYDSEGGSNDITDRSAKDASLTLHTSVNASTIGPSPSSVVKMEANQKAKKKKERQGLLGTCQASSPEGEVKVRKRSVIHRSKVARLPVRKKTLACEGEHKKKTKGVLRRRVQANSRALPSGPCMVTAVEMSRIASERIKKATRKNKALQSVLRRKTGTVGLSMSPRNPRVIREGKKLKNKLPSPKQGRAVSKLLASFAVEDDFQFDDNSSFSEGEEEDHHSRSAASEQKVLQAPICTISREDLKEGLHVLIPKEDSLLYAGSIKTLQPPDIYSIVIEGERGNRQRIYSQEQLLQEAVLDIKPQSVRALAPGTRVCAYWSQKSRCLYPGNVVRGPNSEEDERANSVVVEFDDGDTGRISLPNIRLLPADYTIKCTEPSPALLVAAGSRRTKRSSGSLPSTCEGSQNQSAEAMGASDQAKNSLKKVASKEKAGKADLLNSGSRSLLTSDRSNSLLSWSTVAQTKRKAGGKSTSLMQNLFQMNGSVRRLKDKEAAFPVPSMSAPIFGNGFGVHSFSSIANSYSHLSMSAVLAPTAKPPRIKRAEKVEGDSSKSMGKKRSGEYLIKLDHEGVTSPKTKNSKALMMCAKDYGLKGERLLPSQGFSHPPLSGKDRKGRTQTQGLPVGLTVHKYASQSEFTLNYDNDCHSSYSDMEEEERGARQGGVPSRYLTRLSGSSSSSGSSTSSSSGSTSSLCSSDNEDSSYSSEVEDSTLLLQTCISHPSASLLTSSEALHTKNSGPQHCFVAKATAVGGPAKVKRKEGLSFSKAKELARRQRLPSVENRPKISAFLPARQLWKWSGNPTQRRGMKGRAKKLFYKAIVRGKETLNLGDCAVFLSAGRPNLPYIGRIESMWESWGSNMVVKVKWFYHPEETKLGKRHSDGQNALYQSCHEDENDVQTVSHKCQVVSREQYEQMTRNKRCPDRQDLYYLAGTYDPTTGRLVTADGVPVLC